MKAFMNFVFDYIDYVIVVLTLPVLMWSMPTWYLGPLYLIGWIGVLFLAGTASIMVAGVIRGSIPRQAASKRSLISLLAATYLLVTWASLGWLGLASAHLLIILVIVLSYRVLRRRMTST